MRPVARSAEHSWLNFIFALFVAAGVALCSHATAVAANSPQSFTYQGRFFTADGSAPLTDTVDVTFEIYDPSGICLLYAETHSGVNLSLTSGVFSQRVGAGVRVGGR